MKCKSEMSKINDDFLLDYYGDIIAAEGMEFILELYRRFLISAPKKMQEIENAIETKDLESLFFAVHSLKNLAANVGGMALSEIGKKLENLIEENKMEESHQFFIQLKLEYEETIMEVRERLSQSVLG